MRSRKLTLVVALVVCAIVMATMPTLASAQTETILTSFNGYGTDGAPYEPSGGVIFDKAGNLYGTTYEGGISNGTTGHGTVYELSPAQGSGWTVSVLGTFLPKHGTIANGPIAGLLIDSHGNLYGTDPTGGTEGGGFAFEFSPKAGGGWSKNVLYNFGAPHDAYYTGTALIMDRHGNLYGASQFGGTYGYGTVYELSPPTSGGTWTEKVLFSFNRNDGGYLETALVLDADGNLYGTTSGGGEYFTGACQSGCGTVFKLVPSSSGNWTLKVLHSFNSNGTDGFSPKTGLVFDAAGNLYGATTQGGTGSCKADHGTGCGTVYQLSPAGSGPWTETILYSFQNNGSDGIYPQAGNLIFDASGNLYGTTGLGGLYVGGGTVFKLAPAGGGWIESILHNFDNNGTDGYGPSSGLTLDAQGNLYGTTAAGGNAGGSGGTVYEITQ
jgi:uncharacterized repeat protein (TIGR03803 family)